jgi:hypothetical protein
MRRRSIRRLATAALVAAAFGPAVPASASGPEEVTVGAGVFDVGEPGATSEADVELRFTAFHLPLGELRLEIEPAAGAMVNADGGFFAYTGFGLPWALGRRWEVTPYTGVGIYSAGDGKDLGGPVEFRSGLEVSLAVGERSRLGLSFYHLSNAVLYDLNPGEESLSLVYSYRFGP